MAVVEIKFSRECYEMVAFNRIALHYLMIRNWAIGTLILALVMVCSNLAAQSVFSCKNKKGNVIYQDFPCGESESNRASGSGTRQTLEISPPQAANVPNTYKAELQREFEAALQNRDFEKAARLSMTSEQQLQLENARKASSRDQNGRQRLNRDERPSGTTASGCYATVISKPQPFLGTANEIIVLSDGSVWQDMSYKYLYLYAYLPQVTICPGLGKMTLESGGKEHVFNVMRLR